MNSTALESIIEVAIGMVFMWLVLSIATMTVQEWIASRLKWRSKDLKTATRRLLGDPRWADQLYAHPLIQGLAKKPGSMPSYIPANKFALALFDIIMTAGTHESYIQRKLHAAQEELDQAPDGLLPLIKYGFGRWGTDIRHFFIRARNFLFDSQIVTGTEKYNELIELAHQLSFGDTTFAQEKLQELLTKLVEDQKGLSTAKFMNKYPAIEAFLREIIAKVNEFQPDLDIPSQAEIEKLAEKIRPALDQIDYAKLIEHLKSLADPTNSAPEGDNDGELMNHGLQVLQKLNPKLYRSLNRMRKDLVGIANNTEIMEAVRERFVKAIDKTDDIELNLEAMRLGAENWFNESMDRLSGWYKRKATALAFIIALVLASFLNVDSIFMVEHLWKDPAVRQALAATAENYAVENEEIQTPEGGVDPAKAVEYFNDQFDSLNVPLGWETELPSNINGWLIKALGIILSAGAATQGAPFWFDILKKLVNVRGSGANPEEKKS